MKPLEAVTLNLDTELDRMKSDHRRDYFVMKCKEVSENLEEMVESRT